MPKSQRKRLKVCHFYRAGRCINMIVEMSVFGSYSLFFSQATWDRVRWFTPTTMCSTGSPCHQRVWPVVCWSLSARNDCGRVRSMRPQKPESMAENLLTFQFHYVEHF